MAGSEKKRRRWLDALVIQAGISAALSFSHIHDVALACGQGAWQSWCYPISVDLLLFAAWQRLRRGEGGKQEWFWFIVALLVSLGANLSHVGLLDAQQPPQILALIVAGWPAVAFLGGTLLVHGRKREVEVEVPEVPAVIAQTVQEPVVSEPEPVSDPVPDPVLEEDFGYDEPVHVPILDELKTPVHVPDITDPEHWDAPREKTPPRMKSWSDNES